MMCILISLVIVIAVVGVQVDLIVSVRLLRSGSRWWNDE